MKLNDPLAPARRKTSEERVLLSELSKDQQAHETTRERHAGTQLLGGGLVSPCLSPGRIRSWLRDATAGDASCRKKKERKNKGRVRR